MYRLKTDNTVVISIQATTSIINIFNEFLLNNDKQRM